MTAISTARNDTSALHRTVPTQSPISLFRQMQSACTYRAPARLDQCCASRHIWMLTLPLARTIVFSHINITAQIAITHRLG
jgi:hypothetical protein